MAGIYNRHGVTVYHGDCLTVLRTMPDESMHAVVTDPPYGLAEHRVTEVARAIAAWCTGDRTLVPDGKGFMGREWDRFVPPPAVWDECLRVLKPGGFLLCFSGSRTVDLMGLSIRLAGFEIRDEIACWVYGSGFPKSRNITADLNRLPRCGCRVPAEVSNRGLAVEQAGLPSGTVGAGVGAVSAAVSLSGLPADSAGRHRSESGPGADRRLYEMQADDPELLRQGDPVVLGPANVTGRAERDQVLGVVGSVEVDPEALRDQMVDNEVVLSPTVGTGAVSFDDRSGDVCPSSSPVLPLTPAPGRVALGGEPLPVGDGHTGPGAVGGDVGPTTELNTADDADVDPVPGTDSSSHGIHLTAERSGFSTCTECSGLTGEVPDGLGTALKPAHEPILVARKPLAGTVAGNVQAHGAGALNIDACRVNPGAPVGGGGGWAAHKVEATEGWDRPYVNGVDGTQAHTAGRWPTNVVLVHHPDCGDQCAPGCPVADLDHQSGVLTSGANPTRRSADKFRDAYGEFTGQVECLAHRGADSGGASRFFPTFRYEAKATAAERPKIDGKAHPTVKPLDLMRWLVRLVTSPGGTVLDPFAGTGTTGHAARAEGFRAVLIEADPDHLPLITSRLDGYREPGLIDQATGLAEPVDLLDLLAEEAS